MIDQNSFVVQHLADLIGADPKDIVFTSGATESNNMSIKGVARFHKDKKKHIITTQTVRVSTFTQLQSSLADDLTGAQMRARLMSETSGRGL